jgi:hypothetical protein
VGSEDLADRLERIERRLAVYDLIAAYGPAVDSGSAETTAELWESDGTYDFGDAVLEGRPAVAAMVRSRQHQTLINGGAAHVLGHPKVDVNGDRAVATCYSQVCRFEEGRFVLWRVSANRWELAWDGSGWKVVSRTARLLDGRESARILLCE